MYNISTDQIFTGPCKQLSLAQHHAGQPTRDASVAVSVAIPSTIARRGRWRVASAQSRLGHGLLRAAVTMSQSVCRPAAML